MGPARIIASQELRDTLYNRWLIGFGILLAVLTVGLSYYGLVSARQIGFQGFDQVAASLLNLVLFAVPMVSMAHPVNSLSADGEGWLILLTQPLARRQVLVGKYLGMLGSLTLTLLGGLGVGGILVSLATGPAYVGDFALLVALTFVLVAVFLAAGLAVAIAWQDRARALGVCLGVWFWFAILYDLLVVGLMVSGPGIPLRAFLLGALLTNPIDGVRVFYLLATGSASFVGVTGAVLSETLGSGPGLGLMVATFVVQAAVALGAASWVLERKDF